MLKKIIYPFMSILFLALGIICIRFEKQGNKIVEKKAAYVNAVDLNLNCGASYLMEESTGKVLYAQNETEKLKPASMTKMMGLLLTCEKIDKKQIQLEDIVTVSENAAAMGGSQVFLEPNETQTVDTMIKCISIASANDAAVAMAEKIAGSEPNFVKKMNEKAKELGMKHTQFKNCTGLDDDIKSGHFSSAYDVGLMSRELIMKHPGISKYSTVWMDTITHKTKKGESQFGLTNTNKLVRFYDGITGLKTGSTSKAKYCLSATAKRNGLNLIAVVMAAPDHKVRFSEAQALLDYGFANCSLYQDDYSGMKFNSPSVRGGIPEKLTVYPKKSFSHTFTAAYDKNKIKKKITYQELKAPIKKGTAVGFITYSYQGKTLGKVPLLAMQDIKKAGYTDYLLMALDRLLMAG